MRQKMKVKYSQIWEEELDEVFIPLFSNYGATTAFVYFYLRSNSHRNMSGIYKLPLGYAAIDLKINQDELNEYFQNLISEGVIEYDFETDEVFVKDMLKRNVYTSNGEPVSVNSSDNRVKNIEGILLRSKSVKLYKSFVKDYQWE